MGVHESLIGVIRSWLRDRTATVVVEGAGSFPSPLRNMVLQGTVWGPPLWNAFFGDSPRVLHGLGFIVVIYADNYNSFKGHPGCTHNHLVREDFRKFQCELHKWGRANQVQFDVGKESLSILSNTDPDGESIRLLRFRRGIPDGPGGSHVR